MQYALPPENHVTKEFFKQLFRGEKNVFKMHEIRQIIVPKLDEMAVTKMLPLVEDDEQFRSYLPDEYFEGK